MKQKTVIGLIENIYLFSKDGKKRRVASKIDTGATKCSLDTKLAARLKLGPVIRTKIVKSAEGNSLRPIVKGTIELKKQKIDTEFTIADRAHLKFDVLIGVNALKKGNFIIDPQKKNKK